MAVADWPRRSMNGQMNGDHKVAKPRGQQPEALPQPERGSVLTDWYSIAGFMLILVGRTAFLFSRGDDAIPQKLDKSDPVHFFDFCLLVVPSILIISSELDHLFGGGKLQTTNLRAEPALTPPDVAPTSNGNGCMHNQFEHPNHVSKIPETDGARALPLSSRPITGSYAVRSGSEAGSEISLGDSAKQISDIDEKKLKVVGNKVLRRWMKQHLSVAFHGWCHNADHRKRMRIMSKKIMGRWTRMSCWGAFHAWDENAALSARLRRIENKVTTFCARNSCRAHFVEWALRARDQISNRRGVDRVLQRSYVQLKDAAFREWASSAKKRAWLRRAEFAVERRWTFNQVGVLPLEKCDAAPQFRAEWFVWRNAETHAAMWSRRACNMLLLTRLRCSGPMARVQVLSEAFLSWREEAFWYREDSAPLNYVANHVAHDLGKSFKQLSSIWTGGGG